MASVAGDIAVRVGADTSGLTKGLADAERSLASFGNSAMSAAGRIAVIATSATAAASAVGILIKSQIDLADAASDAAQKAGVSVEEWSKLSYAFKFGTKDGADLAQTLLFLNKSIAGASNGVKGNIEDFRALDVSYKNTDGTMRNVSDVLNDVADAFQKLPDGANKAALATQLFGKSGADIIPFLNQGSAGIRQLKGEAEKLGVVLSQEAADAANQFNDNMEKLQASVASVGVQIGNAVIPKLAEFSDYLTSGDGLASDFGGSLEKVARAAEVIAAVIAGRVVSSIAASAIAFAAAQAEAIRYQMALARMAGSAGVASAAMGGVASVGRTLLGVVGGPIGLAVAIGTLGLSMMDFSDSATVATESASDFDKKLASITGNTEKLRESQKQLKLDTISNGIRTIVDEISKINAEAEKANAKLGQGETQRIQELQRRLAELGMAYQEVAAQKAASVMPSAQAAVQGGEATGGGELEKQKALDAEKLVAKQAALQAEIEAELWAESEKAANKEKADRERIAAELARIDEQYLTEQDKLAMKLEAENAIIAEAREAGFISKEEADRRELEALLGHQSAMTAIDDQASEQRKRQAEQEAAAKKAILSQAFGGLTALMNSESRKMFEIGKAASISQAIVSTYTGMAKALELGFPLGPIAAGAIALNGFAQVANIRKQSFGGGGGSAASATSNTGAINAANTPVASGGGGGGSSPSQLVNISLVGDIFGREQVLGLIDKINDATQNGGARLRFS